MLNEQNSGTARIKYISINTLLILLILIIRIVFVSITVFISPTTPVLTLRYYELITYLVIFVFIVNNKNNLSGFHVDRLSLICLILFSTIFRSEPYHGIQPSGILIWGFWAISLGILILLVRDWSKLKNIKLKWIGLGVFVGAALPIAIYLPWFVQSNPTIQSPVQQNEIIVGLFAGLFVAEMAHAAIYEEIIFRGFLWGVLRSYKLNEMTIWLIQAVLFLVAHVHEIISHPMSGLYMLIVGLALGWLAWRSRSVAPGMIAHAIYNAMILSIRYLFSI